MRGALLQAAVLGCHARVPHVGAGAVFQRRAGGSGGNVGCCGPSRPTCLPTYAEELRARSRAVYITACEPWQNARSRPARGSAKPPMGSAVPSPLHWRSPLGRRSRPHVGAAAHAVGGVGGATDVVNFGWVQPLRAWVASTRWVAAIHGLWRSDELRLRRLDELCRSLGLWRSRLQGVVTIQGLRRANRLRRSAGGSDPSHGCCMDSSDPWGESIRRRHGLATLPWVLATCLPPWVQRPRATRQPARTSIGTRWSSRSNPQRLVGCPRRAARCPPRRTLAAPSARPHLRTSPGALPSSHD